MWYKKNKQKILFFLKKEKYILNNYLLIFKIKIDNLEFIL